MKRRAALPPRTAREPPSKKFRRLSQKRSLSGVEVMQLSNMIIQKHEKNTRELNFWDTASSATSVDATGTVLAITDSLPKGTGAEERVGTEITAKSLLVRYQIINADSHNVVRVIVFTFGRTGAPGVSTILQDTSTVPWLSPLSQVNTKFIRVLHNNIVTVDSDDPTKVFDVYVKLKNHKISWQPTTTTNEKGNIYVLFISDSVAASHPTVNLSTRLKFLD